MIRRPEHHRWNCQQPLQVNFPGGRTTDHVRNPWSLATVGWIVLSCICLISSSVQVLAEDTTENPPAHIILLDGSGSMWGKLKGGTLAKFLAAKEALAETLPQLPEQTPLGLVTFGRSCSGAGVAIPPEAGTGPSIVQRIGNLNPKSKGPIALALQRAAKALPEDTAGSFVLIHDGSDNCRQDPCAVARDIAKRHPRLKINLVSVGVTPKAASAMRCVAQETGGKVYAANNTATLKTAVAGAFGDVITPPQRELSAVATKADSATPPASTNEGPPGLQLSASLVEGGPELDVPLLWLVTKNSSETNGEQSTVIAAEAASIVRRLDPGSYKITASIGLSTGRATATVGKQGTASVRVVLNAGQIAFGSPQDGQTGFVTVKPISADGATTNVGQQSWLGRSNAPPLVAPSGIYQVIYEDGLLRSEKQAVVKDGATANVDLATRSGELQLGAQTPAGTPITDIAFQVRIDDPAATGGGRNVLRTRSSAPTIRLPAGTYVVTASTHYAQQSKRIVVGANANISEVFTFELGEVSLTANLVGSASQSRLPLAFRVTQGKGKEMREISRSSDRTPSFALPTGQYLVSVALGAGNVQSSVLVNIAADEKKDITLKLDAGSLTLTRSRAQSGPQNRDMLWEVIDAHGQVVWRTNQLNPTTLLAPGRYTVRNEARNGVAETALQLDSGADEVVVLGR